ncbi:MAG TPA: type IV secretory system conjugative DNA transfer family protein [Gammaproteobacteria bacterium]|jgi:defect-in-organelle-trafficking protein DotC|nr:type IV secretory system conjugative DNA transfer family protein [Gammaproteobacteria bacterium]
MKKSLLLGVFILMLTACSHHQQNVDTTNLNSLESVRINPRASSSSPEGLSSLRSRSLKDTALSLGAQGGLAWSSTEINKWLTTEQKYLDSIFNFNPLMLEHGVMPPVLEMGDDSLNLADPNTIRVADRTYKIVQQAQFATTPPNWRDYLMLNYSKPEMPDRTLLPRSSAEQKVWRDAIRLGWDKGVEQGYAIFQQNLSRLKRDFNGMLIYRRLLKEKMISSPYVARTELGVTGDGNDMRINDQVLRIVEHPQLQTNSKGWRAIVVKDKY